VAGDVNAAYAGWSQTSSSQNTDRRD
jgi:hypothetical protein